jgi:hypothetical protein
MLLLSDYYAPNYHAKLPQFENVTIENCLHNGLSVDVLL